jgi:O-glycosyl hydrolase
LNGVGVHIFDNDHANPKFEDALDELKLKYLRVPFGPEWNTLSNEPPDCNNEDDYQLMYTFISNNFNGDYPIRLTNAISTSAIAQSLGIEIILVNWRAHKKWVTNDEFKELMEIYLDDYACFVVAVVEFLTNNGVNINYLEPTNEPSDTSDTKIPPERYNRFVKTLREALDGEGVDALSVWASHAWDPVFSNGSEEGILKMKWEEFQKEIKEQESSTPPKPIFITEYACVNDPDNEICAAKNTLTLLDLDCGASVVVYWYLREQSWDIQANRERALLKENYDKKPAFTALTSFLPFISGDEVWVLETQLEGRITVASFYKADEEQLIVVLINSYPEPENVLIDVNGSSTIDIVDGLLYDGQTKTIRNLEPIQCQAAQCQLSLPPATITTFC